MEIECANQSITEPIQIPLLLKLCIGLSMVLSCFIFKFYFVPFLISNTEVYTYMLWVQLTISALITKNHKSIEIALECFCRKSILSHFSFTVFSAFSARS